MQVATADTVLGNFDDASFTYGDVTSTFFKKDGAFYVRTDGPDGALRDYRIAYTFGIAPLQQYLIELSGGRLQALGIAWDTRPASTGGQRWFHLYPGEKVDFRDVLHWTGPAQNWNFMCAECHSTNVKKNYRPEADRYETTWSEVDVSCEACHGPGSAHLDWAKLPEDKRRTDDGKGLIVDLAARGGSWVFDGNAAIAHLNGARDTRVQMVCGRCHARRAQLSDDDRQDRPLDEAFLLSLLEAGLYESDGQILDEVFEYGSFLQSRMHERGVVCSDCHEPHSGRLLAAGNAVCAKCHQSVRYDTPAHHHHKTGTKAAACVACHMPSRTYMVVHERHDHGFRVPRPDFSTTYGTPNVCTTCHKDRSTQWAADAVVRWYGATRSRGPRWTAALAAGRAHRAGADRSLADVIADRSYPAIVRATALSLIANPAAPQLTTLIQECLQDSDPMIRRQAVSLLRGAEPLSRWQAAGPLLTDPSRIVRLEAINTVADTATLVSLTPEQRATFDGALAEYRTVQAFNADRADAWLNLGSLEARLGNPGAAETDYLRGIRLQPSFMPNYLNLADLYRAQARDSDGERVLREALRVYPDSADIHHSLGLTLVRRRKLDEAVTELATATQLAPDNPRYTFVYAVALDSTGRHAEAVLVLEAAQRRFTGDRDILAALQQWALRDGDRDAALRWEEKLRSSEN